MEGSEKGRGNLRETEITRRSILGAALSAPLVYLGLRSMGPREPAITDVRSYAGEIDRDHIVQLLGVTVDDVVASEYLRGVRYHHGQLDAHDTVFHVVHRPVGGWELLIEGRRIGGGRFPEIYWPNGGDVTLAWGPEGVLKLAVA